MTSFNLLTIKTLSKLSNWCHNIYTLIDEFVFTVVWPLDEGHLRGILCCVGCKNTHPRPIRNEDIFLFDSVWESVTLSSRLKNHCNYSLMGSYVPCCQTKCLSLISIASLSFKIFVLSLTRLLLLPFPQFLFFCHV